MIPEARHLCAADPNDPFWKDDPKMLYNLKSDSKPPAAGWTTKA
jgi:hypothetical protein